MANLEAETYRKYLGILRAGARSLATGNIPEYKGVPEITKYICNTALHFTPESEQDVEQRVTSKIKAIGKDLDIEFVSAGHDFPLHSTVLEGEFTDPSVDVTEVIGHLRTSTTLTEILETLIGLKITFDSLLIDRGSVLLAAIHIRQPILDARLDLDRLYTDPLANPSYRLKPRLINDILHISVARITRKPDASQALIQYRRMMMSLLRDVGATPFVMKVESISCKTAFDLLTSHPGS